MKTTRVPYIHSKSESSPTNTETGQHQIFRARRKSTVVPFTRSAVCGSISSVAIRTNLPSGQSNVENQDGCAGRARLVTGNAPARCAGTRCCPALRLQYMEADQTSWSNRTAILLCELTARAVKTAFDGSVIAETDLWGGDKQSWDKISQSRDPAVAASVKLILRYRDFVLVESKPDESKPTVRLQPKIRTIDPDVVTEGGMLPLSALDADFRAYRDDYLKTRASPISLRLAD